MESDWTMGCSPDSTLVVNEAQKKVPSRPSRGKLHLLGTVHHDPRGYRKLRRFLEWHQPDLILLEFSPYGLTFRKDKGPELQRLFRKNLSWAAGQLGLTVKGARKHPEIDAVQRQLSLPFEYRAAAGYGFRKGVSLELIDCSSFSQKMIGLWKELISRENLLQLLSLSSRRPSVNRLYGRACRLIFQEEFHCPRRETPPESSSPSRPWNEREKDLAGNIEKILSVHGATRPLYVGGWQHLTPGSKPAALRDLLEIDKSRCHLLAGLSSN